MSASFGARINIVYYIEISYAVYSCFEGSKFEFYFTHVMFTVSTEYATQFRFDVSMVFSTLLFHSFVCRHHLVQKLFLNSCFEA